MESVDKMIRKFGNSMHLVQSGNAKPIRAFLQESRSKSKDSAYREFSLLGEIPKGVYVYIGPAEPEAQVGDVLLWQQRQFQLRRVEMITVGDQKLYCWGLCVEKGGENPWLS